MKEENLIFIISQPRAGSTYLQNLLSNNSEANTCSESWLLLNFVNQIKPELLKAAYDNNLAQKAFNDYINKSQIDFNLKQKEFLLDLYTPVAEGFLYVIDKTPRYYEILEEISVLFPKAKIIVLKRNPLDVAKSIIKTWNVEDLERLAYYKRDLIFAPKHIQKFCLKNIKNPNVLILKYEDLIHNTAVFTKSVYQWVGLDFDMSMLETSTNNKFKGLYGDTFQNSDDYKSMKKEVTSKKLSKLFEDFLIGYYNYLGHDFLMTYGNYDNENTVLKSTLAFKFFLFFTNEPNKLSFKKEVYWRVKKTLFSMILKNKN